MTVVISRTGTGQHFLQINCLSVTKIDTSILTIKAFKYEQILILERFDQ